MKYILYCRKSSEDRSRQIQSIDDQKRELLRIAEERNLEVLDIIIDSKSAKQPGRRGFGEMMERIQKGEVQGILCWKLDRLARNPIDGASIAWNLQKGIIQQIITPERHYDPSDNVILMNVEFGMANQYIIDLQRNVKRGMKSKVEKGWLPTKAPFGYLNEKHANKGEKRILPDPENFHPLQTLWKTLLRKECSLMELYRIMQNKYPLVSKRGKIMGFSSFERVFRNIFYAGFFTWKGEALEGAHKPMISFQEYERAQEILTTGRDLRLGTLQFDYKGVFRCRACGCRITAEQHRKQIKKTGETKDFRYYRCTHKKQEMHCQEKPIAEDVLEKQLLLILEENVLPEEVLRFGIQEMERVCFPSSPTEEESRLKNELGTISKSISLAMDTLLKESDAEMQEMIHGKIQEMRFQRRRIEERIAEYETQRQKRKETVKNSLELMLRAKHLLQNGTEEDKKEVLHGIGSNWEIQEKKVFFKPHFPILAMKKAKTLALGEDARFEPTGTRSTKTKKPLSELVIPLWSG